MLRNTSVSMSRQNKLELTRRQMTSAKETAASQWAEKHPAGRNEDAKKVNLSSG